MCACVKAWIYCTSSFSYGKPSSTCCTWLQLVEANKDVSWLACLARCRVCVRSGALRTPSKQTPPHQSGEKSLLLCLSFSTRLPGSCTKASFPKKYAKVCGHERPLARFLSFTHSHVHAWARAGSHAPRWCMKEMVQTLPVLLHLLFSPSQPSFILPLLFPSSSALPLADRFSPRETPDCCALCRCIKPDLISKLSMG